MRYLNVLGLVLLMCMNLYSLLTPSVTIGIGIDEKRNIYAVGNTDSAGKKIGYWHFLTNTNNKFYTNVIGYYQNGLADSLWVEHYDDVYPRINQVFFMHNDTVRGYIYQYDKRGHFRCLNYYNKYGVNFQWNYHNDVCIDSIYDMFLTGAHKLMDDDLYDIKYEIVDFYASKLVKYNICLLTILLLVNAIYFARRWIKDENNIKLTKINK